MLVRREGSEVFIGVRIRAGVCMCAGEAICAT